MVIPTFLRKSQNILRKTLKISQNLLKSFSLSFSCFSIQTNIVANTAMEKINKDREEDVLNNKYKDIDHKTNNDKNEDRDNIRSAVFKDRFCANRANNILPPSKDFIGNKFIAPSEKEESRKKSIVSLFMLNAFETISTISPKTIFAAGPPMHTIISSA